MGKVFEDLEILREQPSDVDYFNYTDEIDRVESRIKQAGDNQRNSLVAYLGNYGMGKSQILKIVEKRFDDKNYKWVSFESWRYSSRQDLWQYFTELVSLQLIGNRFTRWLNSHWMDLLVGAVLAASIYVTVIYQPGSWDDWAVRYVKYAAGIVLTSIVGYLIARYIHPKTPLTRIEEFEGMLRRAIKNCRKILVIVVEDVDRTGDDGVTFMESLSTFLKSNNFKRSVIVIAPQKNTILDPLAPEKNGVRPIENGVKIYDESMYLSVHVSNRAIEEFYKNITFTEDYQKHKLAIEWITNELMYYHNGQVSIRTLKYALRAVEYFIEANPKYNPAIAFVVIMSGLTQSKEKTVAYRHLGRTVHVPGSNGWSPSDDNYWQLSMQVAIESKHTDRDDFYTNYIGNKDTGVIKNVTPNRVVHVSLNGVDGDNKPLAKDEIETSENNYNRRVDIRIRGGYLDLVNK